MTDHGDVDNSKSLQTVLHSTSRRANVFSIAPGVPFLTQLVQSLIAGDLVENWTYSDPLQLADVTIFVPTRRAARSLADEFRRQIGGPLILPDIRPLGDSNDDGAFLSSELSANPLALDPVMNPMERRLLLARLIMAWRQKMDFEAQKEFGSERISLPSGPVDAVGLASDLANLMDQVETEECTWNGLKDLVPKQDNYQKWWQTTLDFLQIATGAWPAILAERGMTDPAVHRRQVLDHQTRICEQLSNTKGPVIAAGSTGSIPATARLLSAISKLPKGAVVLPGVDFQLDSAAWHLIGRLGSEKSEPGHPQYALKTLLSDDENDSNVSKRTRPVLAVARTDVRSAALGEADPIAIAKERLFSEVMRPAAATEMWAASRELNDAEIDLALTNISSIAARDVHLEALSIATALRAALEEPGKTAALITPDRELARRVRAALQRFGINADDSAGQKLSEFKQVKLVRLLLEWCLGSEEDKRLVLAALLKHPSCALGLELSEARRRARLIEISALRGNLETPRAGQLADFISRAQVRNNEAHFLHPTQRSMNEVDWQDCRDISLLLDKACEPILALGAREHSTASWAEATIQAVEAICQTSDKPFGDFYEAEGGDDLTSFFASLLSNDAAKDFPATGNDWPRLFSALISGSIVRPKKETHPRLAILGPLEARLLQVDLVVLGGLNEGTWPSQQKNDPFLSRTMKAELGLEPPERRIGQAGHDFVMAMGAKEVLLSRSLRVDGAPTVPSRWLQRLEAVIGEEKNTCLSAKGAPYLKFAETFDAPPDGQAKPIAAPMPRPPLAVRPKSFSFSEVEALIRDPYAIYAKRVLCLRPIDPLVADPSAADRGTLLHAVFALWIKDKHDPTAPNAMEKLHAIGRVHFDDLQLPPEMEAFWWPHFKEVAAAFLKWQPTYDANLVKSLVEVSGSLAIDPEAQYHIRGRADRIDITKDGQLIVLDYKGNHPSISQVRSLLAPQIPLEAAVASQGGFEGVGKADLSDMVIVRLKAGSEFRSEKASAQGKNQIVARDLAIDAWAQLQALVAIFHNENHAYHSRTRPQLTSYSGDYDHLARAAEWGAANLGDGDNDGGGA